MATITAERNRTTIFHLVRIVDGKEVPYVPYQSDCSGCCSTSTDTAEVVAAEPAAAGCCCGH